jgi:C4-dicarboxylate-specific signal transduction histidine kinase
LETSYDNLLRLIAELETWIDNGDPSGLIDRFLSAIVADMGCARAAVVLNDPKTETFIEIFDLYATGKVTRSPPEQSKVLEFWEAITSTAYGCLPRLTMWDDPFERSPEVTRSAAYIPLLARVLCLFGVMIDPSQADESTKFLIDLGSQAAAALYAARSQEALANDALQLQAIRSRIADQQASLDIAEEVGRTGSFRWRTTQKQDTWSNNLYNLLGFDQEHDTPSFELFLSRVHPDDREKWIASVFPAVAEQRDWQVEYRILLPDFTVRHLVSIGRYDNSAEYFGAAIDVTELRAAEDSLQTTQAELSRVSRITTMGELAASIAHEVNQPLTATAANVAAGLRWLDREPPNIPRLRDSLLNIIRDARRAGEIIHGLNRLAQETVPTFDRLRIDDLIRDTLVIARPQIERHGVWLEVDLASGGQYVVGQWAQLQQVLLNLFANALETMDGIVDRRRTLRIKSDCTANQYIEVSVSDTGCGLDERSSERLFEAFYTTKPFGMGMGLSICRTIIESHQGKLSASRQMPYGSIFRFQIPLAG